MPEAVLASAEASTVSWVSSGIARNKASPSARPLTTKKVLKPGFLKVLLAISVHLN